MIQIRRLNAFAALVVALAALGAPVAHGSAGASGEISPATTTPSIQIQVVEPGDFRWHDAAVGSLAAIGLALVVGGIALARQHK